METKEIVFQLILYFYPKYFLSLIHAFYFVAKETREAILLLLP